ncbi:MAG: hypothetical protein K2W82_07075 [Candidatus Obscuribacterales bacterium]|nr:hypothetical protein [Candidatus Obscuribacterales bacterium]
MNPKLFTVLISLCLLFSTAAEAAPPLKGSIQTEDYRIRAGKNSPQAAPAQAPNFIPQNGMQDSPVNSAAFAAPSGRVQQDNLQSGLVQSQDFANLPKNFDIGADRGSKEMVLAWERWHKQLAAAIYQIWNGRANSAGKAVLRVTVYRNRTIVPEIMEINGTTAFRRTIMSVFRDLEGNPGLSFPSKSQRDKVSFEAEYIAGTDVNPGYSWLKGDYEKVRQDY